MWKFSYFLLVRIVQAVQAFSAHRRIVSASSTFHESEKKNRTKEEGGKRGAHFAYERQHFFLRTSFYALDVFKVSPREKMPLFCQHDTPLEFPLFFVFTCGDSRQVK